MCHDARSIHLSRKTDRIVIGNVTHWISGNTQQERYEKAARLMISSGIISPPAPQKKKGVLFRPYSENWYRTYRQGKIRHTTAAEYNSILKNHLYPIFAQKELTAITAADVQKMMDSKAALAKKTVHEIKMVLGMILDSAYQDGLIPRNPARDPRLRNPATGSTPRKALTPEELFSIIRQLPNLSQPHDQRFMALLIYTGMRREEALALRWADIDFERGFIHVHGAITFQGNKPVEGPTKTEKGNRYIPLIDALRPWLLQRSEGDFVVYDKVTSSFVKRMWERIQREINVYGATPHCFRHTFTTIAYHNGVNEKTLQALGGWSDIATMRDIYTHVDFQELQNAKISLNAFFQAKMW